MIINNVLIPVEPYQLILTLRNELAKKGIYRFSKIYYRGSGNLMFNCPIHKNGQERHPSCSLVLEDYPTIKAGTVKCFSCNYTASIFEMISQLFGKRDFGEYGKRWVSKTFNFEIVDDETKLFEMKTKNYKDLNTALLNRIEGKMNYDIIPDSELAKYRYYHPYMFERKLTKKVIKQYDVGYDSNFNFNGKIIECLTFPIHDMYGNVYAILRRAIDSKRFFIPKNFEKPVYGIYQLEPGIKRLYVTESIINCLTLRTWGYNAVALLGLGSENQIRILKRLDAFVFRIVFDGDESGRRASYKLKNSLEKSICTRIVHMTKGKDVNDLSKEEFNNLEETW